MAEGTPPILLAHDPDRPGVAALNGLFGQRKAPDEVLAPSHDEEYITYRKLTDFREPYRCVKKGALLAPPPLTPPSLAAAQDRDSVFGRYQEVCGSSPP